MRRSVKSDSVLITGGAGFIGTNVAKDCAEQGYDVHVFDNLSRPGVERNVAEMFATAARYRKR